MRWEVWQPLLCRAGSAPPIAVATPACLPQGGGRGQGVDGSGPLYYFPTKDEEVYKPEQVTVEGKGGREGLAVARPALGPPQGERATGAATARRLAQAAPRC